MSGNHNIRVGSRKSELALIQTKHVITLLKKNYPEKDFEIVTMNTLGDTVLNIPLPKIGEKSLFTKELESALSSGTVNFVVHSLKDLPTTLPEGMAIGAVLTRENPRDALVLQKDLEGYTLDTLPNGSVIGTSSLRRGAQLSKKYPHLKVENIRGNLNTRLTKLDQLGKYQAIILAAAGLTRIGWEERISKIIDQEDILYAVGQGALAVECRANDKETLKLLEPLYDLQTALLVTAERSFLKTLGGGCSAPIGVYSDIKIEKANKVKISLTGAVWSLDGQDEIKDKAEANAIVNKVWKCAKCPYNNNSTSVNLNIEDIETPNNCTKCPFNSSDEPVSKKLKLEDIPNEILSIDPHNQCPIRLPVGVDFMGKCPYLETGQVNIHDTFLPGSSTDIGDLRKCPFLKENMPPHQIKQRMQTSINTNTEENNGLFCGLVPHKDATVKGMQSAVELGERLAYNIISKGGLGIMSKAQSIVHDSIAVVSNIMNNHQLIN